MITPVVNDSDMYVWFIAQRCFFGKKNEEEQIIKTYKMNKETNQILTNMLVVTTSVRMLYRVHGDTTHVWPAVTLDLVFVVCASSLKDGFVNTSTTSYDT